MGKTSDNSIKLIALDIDGTLLMSNGKISTKTLEAINKATKKGIQVILSTGRPVYFCDSVIGMLEFNNYMITASGGEIRTQNMDIIERNLFKYSLIEELAKLGNEMNTTKRIVSTKKVFNRYKDVEDFAAHKWLKIEFYSTLNEKLEAIKNKLEKYDNLEVTNSHPSNIEVNPKGVNKANAIEVIANRLGIKMEEVMAIGDSLNDIKMIKRCGIGIAMGNAQQKVKKLADFVTDTNDNDGVAKAIHKYAL